MTTLSNGYTEQVYRVLIRIPNDIVDAWDDGRAMAYDIGKDLERRSSELNSAIVRQFIEVEEEIK